MSGEPDRPSVRFEPLRPASRARLVAGLLVGPVLWVVTLVVGAWLFDYSSAIVLGLLVALAAFLVSLIGLGLVYAARRRQERRYADGR